MDFFCSCHNLPVYVSDTKENKPALVLLHGYLETLAVWDDFTGLLRHHFRIVRIDLPGHGLSGTNPAINTMDFSAQVVHEVLQKTNIPSCVVCGHSMGGYVALAFAKNYPDSLKGLCLFHSTPNPDSPQKQEDRDREIALVRAGKLIPLVKQSMPRLFAEANEKRLAGKINELIETADVHEPDGIVACLEGMKQRPDQNSFLASFTKPLLLVFGEKDRHIPLETAQQIAAKCSPTQTLWLKNSGHAGFIEEPEQCADCLVEFVKSACQ